MSCEEQGTRNQAVVLKQQCDLPTFKNWFCTKCVMMYGPSKFASLFPSNMGFGFLNEGQKPSFWCIIGVFGQIWPQQNKTKRTRTPENVRYKEAFGGIQVINCQGMVVSCCLHKNSCPDDTMPLNILNKNRKYRCRCTGIELCFPFCTRHTQKKSKDLLAISNNTHILVKTSPQRHPAT